MVNDYYVSYLSLIELDNLNKIGKLNIKLSLLQAIERINYVKIGICFGNLQELEKLHELEMKTVKGKIHGDYIDRMIIATAIANKHTLISADEKFPYYEKDGLKLIQV
jgi:PIN domain nuclease of toxin-antitoxin system